MSEIQLKRSEEEILRILLFRQPKDHWRVLLESAPHLALLVLKDHMGREILSGSRHISHSHRSLHYLASCLFCGVQAKIKKAFQMSISKSDPIPNMFNLL